MFDSRKTGPDRQGERAPLTGIARRLPQLGLLAGAILAGVIGVLTLTPVPAPYAATLVSIDKLYHLIAFAGLVFPVIATGPRRWIWVAPLAIAYGGAIELIQPHVNRTGTWADFTANTIGVALGVWAGRRAHGWLQDWIAAGRR